ncbi:MAG: RICIN domain-containing protein [Dyella sp.]
MKKLQSRVPTLRRIVARGLPVRKAVHNAAHDTFAVDAGVFAGAAEKELAGALGFNLPRVRLAVAFSLWRRRQPLWRPALLTLGLLAAATHASAQINQAPPQTAIVSGAVYTLTSKTSGLLLDNTGSAAPGALWQWSSGAGNTNQQWQIVSQGNGQYALISLSSGLALDDGESSDNGALAMQTPLTANNPDQLWSLISVGGGYYQLVNAASGKALDNSGATTNGGPVWQWDADTSNINQMWLIGPVHIGATTPFTSYEAESGTLSGGASVVALTAPPQTKFSSPELEASGHAYVHLGATGQEVSWINTTGHAVNAINVRYSIPDAPGGGGITSTLDLYVDGVFRQAIAVNSKQTWIYESDASYDGMNQDPSAGIPHVFWDESHAFISGEAVAPGSTISLVKDAANTAPYYNVDVVDIEAPPAPLTQPANSLSIVSYGAVPNDIHTDSTAAIQNCINDAQSRGMSVWIPQGTFYLNTPAGLSATGITIQGAGMWYSTVYYNPPLPAPQTNNVFAPLSVVMRDFAIDGNAISGWPGDGNAGAINIKGEGWVIDSLWIQHEGAGIWAEGTNGIVENSRINNTWADGINLNNGSGDPGNDRGINLIAQNNFIRGSGDDGLAINDNGLALQMNNTELLNNTVVAPWWANDIGIYGGTNDLVANNLVTDSVKEYGISIGVFGSQGGPIGSADVQGNTILRGGSFGYGNRYPSIGVGVTSTTSNVQNVIVRGNTSVGAMFDGVDIDTQGGALVENTIVDTPGLNGFVVEPGAQGSALLLYNALIGLPSGQSGFLNQSSSFSISGTGNLGFSVP